MKKKIYSILHSINPTIDYLVDILVKSLNIKYIGTTCIVLFVNILEKHKDRIDNYLDINGFLFWDFMDEINSIATDRNIRVRLVTCLVKMYLLVCEISPDSRLFYDVNNLSYDVLSSRRTIQTLTDNYLGRERMFIVSATKNAKEAIWAFDYENLFIAEKVSAWINDYSSKMTTRNTGVPEFVNLFEKSLAESAAKIVSDDFFNGSTFRQQISFFKIYFVDDNRLCRRCVTYTISFYNYLIDNNPSFELNDPIYNKTLFRQQKFATWLLDEYAFVNYNSYAEAPTEKNVIFVISGMNRFSSAFLEEDVFPVRIPEIESPYYRQMIYAYILSSPQVVIACGKSRPLVCRFIPIILENKKKHNKEDSIHYFTNRDALMIRNMVDMEVANLSSKNGVLGALRRFFVWGKDNNWIQCDELFIKYLKQFEEVSQYKVNDICDEDLELLNNELLKRRTLSDRDFMAYVIFILLLNTHFRIGTLVKLDVDCITESVKPNQYILRTNSKTSHGEKHDYPISLETKLLLDTVIEKTEPLRERVNVDGLRKKIFLIETRHGVDCFYKEIFADALKNACKNAGTPQFNSRNVRNTYMTKAVEYALKNNKNQFELSSLTKHRSFETTNRHYLSLKLTEMLEATYGVIIGEDATKQISNVVDNIPQRFNSHDRTVENGCGQCTANGECNVTAPLTCLICKHFVTTVMHEQFFIKEIERIDSQIISAKTMHDKEDLTTIKKLYVKYLIEINIKKGEQGFDRN